MEQSPTAGDFLRSSWRWFKRNYGNVMLTLILIFLVVAVMHLGEINADIWSIERDIQNAILYGRV